MTDPREELAKAMIRGLEQMIATATTDDKELTQWQRSEVQEMIHEYAKNDVPNYVQDYVQDMVYENVIEVLDDVFDERIDDWIGNNLSDKLTINIE